MVNTMILTGTESRIHSAHNRLGFASKRNRPKHFLQNLLKHFVQI